MRPLTIVAVGGGSLGDAGGFLASILWRGVDLWHIPTTLVAMVDSAHGGKTAVNIEGWKNQLGTFYPAQRVILVEEILARMPARLRYDGLVEALKAFWLTADSAASLPDIDSLLARPYADIHEQLRTLIDRAIAIKLDVVRQDPFEREGLRRVLNLGHTLGHALELSAGLSHGRAVAWGLAAMLELSGEFGLPEEERSAAYRQLYPLLFPLPLFVRDDEIVESINKDKKRRDGALHSVVLQGTGRPKITDEIRPRQWLRALEAARKRFGETQVRVRLISPTAVSIRPAASKSELNRALIVAALRQGRTVIHGSSSADDVKNVYDGLAAMGFRIGRTADGFTADHKADAVDPGKTATLRRVFAGEGGATFRFLLALAAINRYETRIYAAPSLMKRPHDALLASLRNAGATVTAIDDDYGTGYSVHGWESMPASLAVDVSRSSQFASALALLSLATNDPLTLRLEGTMPSSPYFDMTLETLRRAGVEVVRGPNVIAFNPTGRLKEEVVFEIEPDASSAAVWKVAEFLGHPVQAQSAQKTSLQPDARIAEYLRTLSNAGAQTIILDLQNAPDLVPVLTVAALRSPARVEFKNIAHLAFKESDRLDGFVVSMKGLGVELHRTETGFITPNYTSITPVKEARFATHGDHRLVMAGVLLSMILGPLRLDAPWSVTKSYPEFWEEARSAGWEVAVE